MSARPVVHRRATRGRLTGFRVQLLLFLSALLASLTGAFAGERGVAVQRPSDTAISRAADAAIDVAVQATIALPAHVTRTPVAAPVATGFAVHPAPALRPARLTSERRLE